MSFINLAESNENIEHIINISSKEWDNDILQKYIIVPLKTLNVNNTLICSKEDSYILHNIKMFPNLKTLSTDNSSTIRSQCGGLPKQTGVLQKGKQGVYIQYFKFTPKMTYLQTAYNDCMACLDHLSYFIMYKKPLVTQQEGKYKILRTKEELTKAFKYMLAKCEYIGADIETTSLKFYNARLVSIAFAISSTKSFVYHCKLYKDSQESFEALLKAFFTRAAKKKKHIIWHGGSYDLKVLAYRYFDGDSRILYETYEDTQKLHYILTNSPEREPRDLGTLGAPLCGEYKLTKAEYNDMMSVDPIKCCKYNADDARATLWLYPQLRPKIHSEYLYDKFKKWQWTLTQMELSGIPVDLTAINEMSKEIDEKILISKQNISTSPYVQKAVDTLLLKELEKINAKRVTKKNLWEISLTFNPVSPIHKKVLFLDILKYPVLKISPKGAPSLGAKILPAYKAHTKTKEEEELLENIIDYLQCVDFKSKFVKSLKECTALDRNGNLRLFGTFNLAKVVSGRLSSSDPNLQNLPSSSALSKYFKKVCMAPEGWIWGGADYASLEERINTILTKDPNKLAVYHDGYDGHSFRAFYYYPDELKELHKKHAKLKTKEEKVALINSIEDDYKDIRSDSKGPTFTLQYLGTYYSLMFNNGFSEEKAKRIEENYHKLYAVSDSWLQSKLDKAAEDGFVEVAFGLRIYCPSLPKVVLNSSYTPSLVRKQIRTLGNAIAGQSYGQLTMDAAYKFLKRVYDEGKQDSVKLVANIHDALYPEWKKDKELTVWVNKNLIECMEDISEHPELQNSISIPTQLEIHSPSWASKILVPKDLTVDTCTFI